MVGELVTVLYESLLIWVLLLKQVLVAWAKVVMEGNEFIVTVVPAEVAVQPEALVTVTVYVPAVFAVYEIKVVPVIIVPFLYH